MALCVYGEVQSNRPWFIYSYLNTSESIVTKNGRSCAAQWCDSTLIWMHLLCHNGVGIYSFTHPFTYKYLLPSLPVLDSLPPSTRHLPRLFTPFCLP